MPTTQTPLFEDRLEAAMDRLALDVFPERVEKPSRNHHGVGGSTKVIWHKFSAEETWTDLNKVTLAICGVDFAKVDLPQRFRSTSEPLLCPKCAQEGAGEMSIDAKKITAAVVRAGWRSHD